MAARDKEKEDNKDGEQQLLWSTFDDNKCDNTDNSHFTFFTKDGIRTEQDGGDDEVNYHRVTENTKKGNSAKGKIMILLDNQSTCNVFYAGHLLNNIRKLNHSLTIHSNTGSTKTARIGDIPVFGPVWSHKTEYLIYYRLPRQKNSTRLHITVMGRTRSRYTRDMVRYTVLWSPIGDYFIWISRKNSRRKESMQRN